ncbi:hypothetical protein [Streptomyces pseudogriseolus]|uniref:hypothetical protein n=1 Tax=Streptomyces pseudogriseolus TaxID=36817 RepID=UPI003FA33F9F
MPTPIPSHPRRDDTAADMGTLVRLGYEEPQPVPAPAPETNPFQEPVYDPPLPDDPA